MKRYFSTRVSYEIPEAEEFVHYAVEGIDHYFLLPEEELAPNRQLLEKILQSVHQQEGLTTQVVGLNSGNRVRFCASPSGNPQKLLFLGLPFSVFSFQGDLNLYEVYRLENLSFAFVEALSHQARTGYKAKLWGTLQVLYGIKPAP